MLASGGGVDGGELQQVAGVEARYGGQWLPWCKAAQWCTASAAARASATPGPGSISAPPNHLRHGQAAVRPLGVARARRFTGETG
ncbi:hypothetical protein ACWDAZ_28825 [Streptomyces sp. NPDC001215]